MPFSPSSPLMLPDQFSWAMAEIRPSFPQPIRTRWRVACRCVVLLGINGRCSAIFTGRPTCLAANAASTASARMNNLPPKPPPIWGESAHLGRIDAEDRRHALPGPVDHLVRRPQRERVTLPGGDGGVRLHHRMTFVGGAIGLVELHLGARVGGVEIAQRLPVGLAVTPLCQRCGRCQGREIEAALAAFVAGADQRRGSAACSKVSATTHAMAWW